MDSLGVHTESLWVLSTSNKGNSSQGIDVKVHQVMVHTGTGMTSDDGKVNIFVNHGEQDATIGLQGLEFLVDVWLRDEFAVCLWVLKEEAISLGKLNIGMHPTDGLLSSKRGGGCEYFGECQWQAKEESVQGHHGGGVVEVSRLG